MKILAPLFLAAALASCGTTKSSVEWVDYGDDPMQNPDFMTDMMAAGTPGEHHEMLGKRSGSWKVDGAWWMTPDSEAVPMMATARAQSMLGGRYLLEEFKSDFNGMPFEGRLLQGYNNITGEFWCVWCDNMSTGAMMSTGTETSPGVIEYRGTATDHMTPGGRPSRMTITDNGDGSYTMRMFDHRDGTDEFMSMELKYSR